MMRALTCRTQATHQRGATLLDMEGVMNGDQFHLMQPISTYKGTHIIIIIPLQSAIFLLQLLFICSNNIIIPFYYFKNNIIQTEIHNE